MYKAAKILGCSYIDLNEHPDKLELMKIAFTVSHGENEGEYLRELNPVWQRQKKEMSKQMERAAK